MLVKNEKVVRESEIACQVKNILDGNLYFIFKPYFS